MQRFGVSGFRGGGFGPPASPWRSNSSRPPKPAGAPSTHPAWSPSSAPASPSPTANKSNDPTNRTPNRTPHEPANPQVLTIPPRIAPPEPSTNCSTTSVNPSTSRGRSTRASAPSPASRRGTSRRTAFGSQPANLAALCAHFVLSNASKISIVSLPFFFTESPALPTQSARAGPIGDTPQDRADTPSTPNTAGRSTSHAPGDHVTARREINWPPTRRLRWPWTGILPSTQASFALKEPETPSNPTRSKKLRHVGALTKEDSPPRLHKSVLSPPGGDEMSRQLRRRPCGRSHCRFASASAYRCSGR